MREVIGDVRGHLETLKAFYLSYPRKQHLFGYGKA